MEVAAFDNSPSEVVAHHFCCIPFVESKPRDLAHAQGEVIIQGHEYMNYSRIGAILEFLPLAT